MEPIYCKVNFHPHGFKEEDLTENEWNQITDEYMRLRDEFCELANGKHGYESINREFNAFYPDVGYVGGQTLEGYLYGTFVAWRLNELIRKHMRRHKKFMRSDILEPFVFLDGITPDLGCRLKAHEDWTIDMTLVLASP